MNFIFTVVPVWRAPHQSTAAACITFLHMAGRYDWLTDAAGGETAWSDACQCIERDQAFD
ncbi:hypothetical protein ACH79_41630 [Bradyrhizobium sp. CCBAU 051011]|jgi:hypothetical protein|nr:hypothetical protein ACH79_41630 [Bradyrhizobium sp. CCBAU 051011]